MKLKEHKIDSVEPGSIAEEMGIESGDILLEVNGKPIQDVFDYHFLINDVLLTLLIRKPNGEEWELEIEKDYYEDPGIVFENGLMDDYKSCYNKCIFCFIDQMPPNMRETLYFKDDDSRLSFLQANYVTNGVAHARTLAQKGCRVFLPGGLLRPQTEAIVGAAAVSSLQQYNFTKAFMGANGVALEAGFTTPDPEEAAVKATVVHRARESWFLVDDAKFARICPAVIADLHSGAILTNRCPNPKYKQYTLVKETEL